MNRLEGNPVALHGGLEISYGSHQSFDTGTVVQVLRTSVVVTTVMRYPRTLAVFDEEFVR